MRSFGIPSAGSALQRVRGATMNLFLSFKSPSSIPSKRISLDEEPTVESIRKKSFFGVLNNFFCFICYLFPTVQGRYLKARKALKFDI